MEPSISTTRLDEARSRFDEEAVAAMLEPKSAGEVLEWAFSQFGQDMYIACSLQKTSSVVVQLATAINPAARDDPNTQILVQVLGQAIAQTQAQDVFEAYGQALQAEAGIRLDQAVINAVHAQFP